MLPLFFYLDLFWYICYIDGTLKQGGIRVLNCVYHIHPYELGHRWYTYLGGLKREGYFQVTPCILLG